MLAAVLFVYYRWRDSGFSWQKFVAVFVNVDWSWLALALALILATYVGRAMRWEIMLRPLSSQVRLWRLVVATCIGFTAVVLFGRAGEPVRPYLIARKEGVSFSSQVAAWLVERILDLLMVLLIFGIALTQISRSGIQPGPHIRSALEAAGLLAGITGAASLALLLGLRRFRGKIRTRLMEALSFLPERGAPESRPIPGCVRRRDAVDPAPVLRLASGGLHGHRVAGGRRVFFLRFPRVSGYGRDAYYGCQSSLWALFLLAASCRSRGSAAACRSPPSWY